jgi:hypothetical protein
MVFSQLSHALSLNDVCDTRHHHDDALATLRSAQPPGRNGLSHANKVRTSEMAGFVCQVIHNNRWSFVESVRFVQCIEILWDSTRSKTNVYAAAATALFAAFCWVNYGTAGGSNK